MANAAASITSGSEVGSPAARRGLAQPVQYDPHGSDHALTRHALRSALDRLVDQRVDGQPASGRTVGELPHGGDHRGGQSAPEAGRHVPLRQYPTGQGYGEQHDKPDGSHRARPPPS